MVLSSMIVTPGAAIYSPSFPARNEAPRQIESPEAASKTEPRSEPATSGAKTIGTRCVGTRRAPSLRSVRRAASLPMDSGDSRSANRRAPDHQPSRCMAPFTSTASGAAETPGIAGAVAAHKAARVGQHLSSGGRVKAAAVGVGNARISLQRRRLCPPRPLNALRARKRVHILVIKMKIAGQRAEFFRLRQPAEGILFGDFGQRQRAFHKLANSLRGQVAGRGRGRPLAQKHAQTQTARAGLLQRLHLAHAHVDAEFVALARHSLGVRRAGFHGLCHHIGSQGFEVEIRRIAGSGNFGHGSTLRGRKLFAQPEQPEQNQCGGSAAYYKGSIVRRVTGEDKTSIVVVVT